MAHKRERPNFALAWAAIVVASFAILPRIVWTGDGGSGDRLRSVGDNLLRNQDPIPVPSNGVYQFDPIHDLTSPASYLGPDAYPGPGTTSLAAEPGTPEPTPGEELAEIAAPVELEIEESSEHLVETTPKPESGQRNYQSMAPGPIADATPPARKARPHAATYRPSRDQRPSGKARLRALENGRVELRLSSRQLAWMIQEDLLPSDVQLRAASPESLVEAARAGLPVGGELDKPGSVSRETESRKWRSPAERARMLVRLLRSDPRRAMEVLAEMNQAQLRAMWRKFRERGFDLRELLGY